MGKRTKPPQKDPQLSATLRQTVEGLRAHALEYADGELMGSEDEILLRHGVSRPTLRQAAALVAQEQLLQVRRGVKGGYIARRPTSRAVTHMAAIFLRTRETSLDEISRSMAPIRAELARLAATNLDDASREAFRAFLKRDAEVAESGGFRAFARSEREFGQLLGAASRNSVLTLFLDILYDLAANIRPEQDVLVGRPERVQSFREPRARLIEAILDGDPGVAELLSNRMSQLIREWSVEEAGRPRHDTAAAQEAAKIA